jgi:hypothetical protein
MQDSSNTLMGDNMNVIDRALKEGRTTLSEYESKQLLATSNRIPGGYQRMRRANRT